MQATNGLQERQNASPVLPSSGRAKTDDAQASKPIRQSRGEKTRDRRGRMSAPTGHSVFVVGVAGNPLTPTTPTKARKLIASGVATKHWSKFGTFGIRMLTNTRKEIPVSTMGIDLGTKFEGYAVAVGIENVLAVKLDLPDKKQIVRKMDERRMLRRSRRHRHCRRRPSRFDNRKRTPGWIAPSQKVIVDSRLKIMRALLAIYPVAIIGLEDVRFNHAKYRWGANFSTMEIGKTRVREFLASRGLVVNEFRGNETQTLRKQYGYHKSSDKSADKFSAHCSDALVLACEVGIGNRIEPGVFLVVDDTHRCRRRKLHDTQPVSGGARAKRAMGVPGGLRKGLLIGTFKGQRGMLCGSERIRERECFRYRGSNGKRTRTVALAWISSNFIVR
jgi:hypothetical protein